MTFYDSNWKKTSDTDYSYCRITHIEADGLFECSDLWSDVDIQMTGKYSSLDPEIREGESIWYHKNGYIKQMIKHKKNIKIR